MSVHEPLFVFSGENTIKSVTASVVQTSFSLSSLPNMWAARTSFSHERHNFLPFNRAEEWFRKSRWHPEPKSVSLTVVHVFFFVFFTFKPNFSVAFIPLIFLFPNKMQSSFFLRSDDVNWYFKTEHEPRLLAFASCFGLSGCQKEQVLSPCYSGDNVTSLLLNTSGISMSV